MPKQLRTSYMAELFDAPKSDAPSATWDKCGDFPIRVQRELKDARARISPQLSFLHLWERVLSDGERARLGGNCWLAWKTWGTIGAWMQLHGVSQMRAIVDVAVELELMTATRRRWLLREIGES